MKNKQLLFSPRQSEQAPSGALGCLHPVVSYKNLFLYVPTASQEP